MPVSALCMWLRNSSVKYSPPVHSVRPSACCSATAVAALSRSSRSLSSAGRFPAWCSRRPSLTSSCGHQDPTVVVRTLIVFSSCSVGRCDSGTRVQAGEQRVLAGLEVVEHRGRGRLRVTRGERREDRLVLVLGVVEARRL